MPYAVTKLYTCPMHPEVRQEKPGICPKCGMSLEPVNISEEENSELKEMSRKFWVALVLTIPIVICSFFESRLLGFIQALFATPVVLWCGFFFFQRAFASLKNMSLNMFTLIALGVGTAYIYSLVTVFFRSKMDLYFEAAAVITVLVLLGQMLELRARKKTSGAIKDLLNLSPKMATLVQMNGEDKSIPLEEVKKGDKLRVKPGEKVPVDGVILEGMSIIDESMITGESVPVEKQAQSKVTGATLNTTGSFVMQAEKVGNETLLARIIQMVSAAQSSRAPIQKLADIVASYFVPIVVGIALLTFFVWGFFIPRPSLEYGIINAVAVLIIACPCALGLATPMSVMVGIGKGARNGILIKNAEAIEKMAKVDTVVIDKTGTLTEGKIHLNHIFALPPESEGSLLQWCASLERLSEHPLSLSIVSKAKEKKLELLKVENFQSFTGKGVSGFIAGKKIAVGNQKLMEDLNISIDALHEKAKAFQAMGQTVLYVAIETKAIGLVAASDRIKESTFEAIESLHHEKISLLMLTGDNRTTAEAIGKTLGIEKIESEILPVNKYDIVKQLQSEGHIVAMAGDGINDAPAIAQADVGIAMGTGTDVAIESGDITLLKGDLRGIARARTLSIATMRNIRQNLIFAFIYNILGVPIAAGILYPFFGLLLSPMIASAAMAFSSVSVIWNALRLRRKRL